MAKDASFDIVSEVNTEEVKKCDSANNKRIVQSL